MADEIYEIKGSCDYGRILYYPNRLDLKFVFEKKIFDSRGLDKFVITTQQSDIYKIREGVRGK